MSYRERRKHSSIGMRQGTSSRLSTCTVSALQSAFLEELLLRNREWGCIPCGAVNMGHPYHTLTVATAVGGDLFLSRDAQFLALHEIFTIINWICVLAYCTCIVVGDNQRTGHLGVQVTSQPWACGRHFATLTLTHT